MVMNDDAQKESPATDSLQQVDVGAAAFSAIVNAVRDEPNTDAPKPKPTSSSESSTCSTSKRNLDSYSTTSTPPAVSNDNNQKNDTSHKNGIESSSALTQNTEFIPLPSNFVIGPHDVWCGRGKSCYSYEGNTAYRVMVLAQLDAYTQAAGKLQKGIILRSTMEDVRTKSRAWHIAQGHGPVGGFVRKGRTATDNSQLWFDVGDFVAKEKTGQMFRDALSTQYSSSAQAKYRKRQRARELEKSATLPKERIAEIVNEEKKARMTVDANDPESMKIEESGLNYMSSNQAESCSLEPCDMSRVSSESVSSTQSSSIPKVASAVMSSHGTKRTDAHSHSKIGKRPVATKASMPDSLGHPNDEIRVCALQSALRTPEESPMDAVLRVQAQMAAIASRESVDMFVLPELCPIGYSEDTFTNYLPLNPQLQALYRSIDKIMEQTAKQLSVYICYGTIGWTPSNAQSDVPNLHIRQKVVDRCGIQVTFYDKTHLCNYGDCKETRFFQPSQASRPVSFAVASSAENRNFRFGLIICADMRYPEISRALASEDEHAVDCILQPAAFSRDLSFRTWSSFRETRAVENSVFWIGVNYAGVDFGDSSIIPPWVDDENEPVTLGTDEGYLMGFVSRLSLDFARTSMPFHRVLRGKTK